MGGPLGRLRSREQELALALAGTLLLGASVAPLAALLVREGTAWAEAWSLITRTSALALLSQSLTHSAAVTTLALALGVPMGVLVGRTDVLGAPLAALVHSFPMFLPPFLLSLGWFHVWGRAGIVGSETTSGILFGPLGVLLVLALAFAPVATALVALGLRGLDPSLEEAARTMARPMRVVVRILLPAAAPACVLAGLIVFTLSFSELGVPMFLRVDTFPAAVFARLGGISFAPGEALGLALPLVPVALALLAVERRFVGARSYAVLGLRSGQRDLIPLGRWRGLASAFVWCVALVSVAPVAALAWRALSGGGFAELGPWLGSAPWHSLLPSAAAATVIVAIGLVVGHAAARGSRSASALDAAAVLSFLAPAALLGVGVIVIWNRPALHWLYGGAGILVVGYVARYSVIGTRTIGVLVAQTPVQLEEAAAAAGAGFVRRLTRIVLPLHYRGLGIAWLLALVFCLRDLELAVSYYPPGVQPLTVRIFTLEANGPEPVVAALAVVHVGLTAAVVAAGLRLWSARR